MLQAADMNAACFFTGGNILSTDIYSHVSSANRTHIGFFGRMNTGKSSLINAFTHQDVSIVSKEAGTTADVVKKPMEIHGIGACLLLDTAGFDDEGELGSQRVDASKKALDMTDIGVVLFPVENPAGDSLERKWVEALLKKGVPVIGVVSQADKYSDEVIKSRINKIRELHIPAVAVSSHTGQGIDELKSLLIQAAGDNRQSVSLTGNLAKEGDVVILVMPQDPQAPQGRLIQPEVQVTRDLLDKHCITISIQTGELKHCIASLNKKPDLIVTDSQAFAEVYPLVPEGTRLTSFSILFGAYKGDIDYYAQSAQAIDTLTENSHVLIAEICTHAPMTEDIGREKIPALLRKRAGKGLSIDICAGSDFPEDLEKYDLIIQCGGCMFNRRHVLSRIERAKKASIPMTNYGVALAYMNGILDKVELPHS